MPIQIPEGFLTRPEAAKLYNRSQRALERELDPALAIRNEKVLNHWRLSTKDGQVRAATGVNTAIVKQLVSDGMTPTWCVEAAWLEEKYGRKGEARPRLSPMQSSSDHSTSTDEPPPRTTDQTKVEKDHATSMAYVQQENEFLKERIGED